MRGAVLIPVAYYIYLMPVMVLSINFPKIYDGMVVLWYRASIKCINIFERKSKHKQVLLRIVR